MTSGRETGWASPAAYMHVGTVCGVKIMTPKNGSGIKRETVSVPVSREQWLRLYRQT